MRRPTSNIIPFPAILPEQVPSHPMTTSQSKRLAKLLDATSQNTAFRSQAIPQAIALCAATAPSLPDPVIVAQVVIGFARRKGLALSSIPKVFREQLLALCAAGDPTALMLRDWLEGNRKLLTKNGVPELSEVHGNGEAV
jgi:hypothetical protein